MLNLGLNPRYIPPAIDLDENLRMNQILYEESVAKELLLPDNAQVLDLGCGRGRVAAHMTRGAHNSFFIVLTSSESISLPSSWLYG